MSQRIVFMGTPDFSVPVLRTIIEEGYEVVAVVTQPDRPKGRKRILTPPPVKVEAEKHNIPVLQPEKIKSEYEAVVEYKPDLIVTAAFGQILPKALLEFPTYGCINVHASLLPELRGGAPIHYAILQGKKETGVTIMYMVEALDAGDMLAKVSVPIADDDHVGTLHDKLSEAGSELLKDTLPKVFNKTITAQKQNHEQATFAYNIKREQERIDWANPQAVVYNHIRGLHPWPVASTTLKGKNIKVWWGEKVHKTYDHKPGTIVDLDNGLVVVCGDGKAIRITDLQPSGKKRMTSESFLRGTGSTLEIGDQLGE
ncbi:methionyl-tRNA formyltransferase [Salinibacillus xinjiangensis]|uniref:Methionyl-tRNA formyltransferase n=1 Tax=Salinibacillus xinjiangensis TaxID=1229268 RepID=A0A6G1X397_9BACI|nr:methionyl-tRNA formyltransferase [Salinibacillus xinjiangensis]MRG85451.1 methionyl-tRNA formyltransferase [Salinibacillus xinjiangensis]